MTQRGRSGHPARRDRPAAPSGSSGRGASGRGTVGSFTAGLRDPAPGSSYPHLLRVEPSPQEPAPWFRSIIGVLAGLLGYAFFVAMIGLAVWQLGWLISGRPDGLARADFFARAAAYETPWGLAASHLGISMLIPISLLIVMLVHRTKPGWLWSVVGRIRWRLLGWSLLVSTVIIAAVLAVTSLLEGTEYDWQPQPGFVAFLIVIALVTPFQAAAEEVFFRGYLMQALGAFGRTPWLGVVLSAVVFAVFHGVQNPALFTDRLVFGLLAGALVWRTGGLETAIAAHVMNNLFAFGLAALTSSVAAARALQEITWAAAAADIAGWTVLALGLWFLAKRRDERVLAE